MSFYERKARVLPHSKLTMRTTTLKYLTNTPSFISRPTMGYSCLGSRSPIILLYRASVSTGTQKQRMLERLLAPRGEESLPFASLGPNTPFRVSTAVLNTVADSLDVSPSPGAVPA